MIPAPFDYAVPTTLAETVAILHDYSGEARILAGGHSLIPLLKTRSSTPGLLVDITEIAGLSGITRNASAITLGALTTHTEIEESRELRERLPIMRQAASVLGDPMIRNRGTFGGSLAYADPAGDWPAVALALGARVYVSGPVGPRRIAIDDFFVDRLRTCLHRDEVLTHVEIPAPSQYVRMSYRKLRHPASGYALVGVAVVLTVDDAGRCQQARIAVTGAGEVPAHARVTEGLLQGQTVTEETIARAAGHAADGLQLANDIYAGKAYRAQLTNVMVARALRAAMG